MRIPRHGPLWLRVAVCAIVLANIVGRMLACQPPGQFTAAILRTAAMSCPAALPSYRSIQIADGAHTIDRMVTAALLEAFDGRDRCGRNTEAR
ncbi:MAG: hypothetical protein GW854_01750 [Erythrobacter sp.]|nr:hypothetical protein [Erythrobacter sp.]